MPKEKRSVIRGIRLTPSEDKIAKKGMKQHSMDFSELIRFLLVNCKIIDR